MNKTLKLIPIVLIVFVLQSCGSLTKLIHPSPTPIEEETRVELIESNKMSLPSDTTKTIIVYNVIENDKKRLISDETFRLLIADFFGTVTTILTLRSLNSTP